MPALKDHKGKQGNKIFCATQTFFFSLLGPEPAPKVHRESREKMFFALVPKKIFRASRPVPAPKVLGAS